MATSNQAYGLDVVMNAIQSVITYGVTTRLTPPMQASNVIEWYDAAKPWSRPRYTGQNTVYFRPIEEIPWENMGAAELGHSFDMTLEVVCCTRLITDSAGKKSVWSRDLGRGHFLLRRTVNDMLQDKMLSTSYDFTPVSPAIYAPTGSPLTIAPIQRIQTPEAVMPPHDGSPGTGDPGWGESSMFFRVPLVDLMTIPTII